MRKFVPLSLFIFICSALFSQTALFNNKGAGIYVQNGGYMIVTQNTNGGSSGVYNALGSGSGQITNQGTIVIQGPLQNDAPITGNGDTIEVAGDWINDNTYSGNNSLVMLNGSEQTQNITGTAVTTFDNLDLSVGPVKKQSINAITTGVLSLNSAELATDVNQMLVTNTNIAAITWTSGFVSSVGAGRLSWVTIAASSYVFPVGSPSYVNGPSIFRPVAISPAAGTDTFGACLVKGNATNDGYNVEALDKTLCLVNPNFYHRLYNGSGAAAADLTMYYNATTDGDWTDEAHWKNNEWNYIVPATTSTGLGFSTVTVPAVSDFNPNPFALAHKKFQLSAGPDVALIQGQSTVFAPVIGAVSGSAIEWTPDLDLTCTTCADPTANPSATTEYTITVTDPAGCKLSDSLNVAVSELGLLIPTGFSPNGDGENDVFHVLNKNLAQIDLVVFNRWGEKIYETTDWTVGWDGTYKGQKQDVGVYVWECSYRFIGESTIKTAKGNVTLIR
jgi:gliding motility-associated-like protein